jgi:hypothetical protein
MSYPQINLWGDWLPALMKKELDENPAFRARVARENNWLDDELFEIDDTQGDS